MRLTIIALIALLFGMNTAIADGHDKANAFGFALNVPAEHIAEVEAVLASHMTFMQSTHSVTGDASTRLNSYSVIKGPVLVDPMDPSYGTTGGMMYILRAIMKRRQALPNTCRQVPDGATFPKCRR